MKKPLVLAVLGIAAILAMGADDDCAGTDVPDSTPPAKQTNANSAPVAEPEPTMTPGQANALEAAKNYLSFSAFSRAGLIDQLSSSAGDGFRKADARFAVNHVGANWKEQAYKSARNYLEMSPFSLSDLIEQLSSEAGEKFTRAQAEYGARKAYNEG